jgi:hypothetical protein
MSKTSLPQIKRLEIIKQELPKGTAKGRIAQLCNVRRETISRDIRHWKQSGGFEEWLQEEFFKLHSMVKQGEPTKAYQIIARLLERTLTRKVESHIRGGQELKITILDEVNHG